MTDLNRNQHYEFWVSYYEELMTKGALTDKGVEIGNLSLTGHCWTQGSVPIPMQEQALYFKVLYPGLLIGIGSTHFSQSAEGEIKLGFTFDPVTGLPFLPGSSVKGILRSAFLANREYVQECLRDCAPDLKLSDRQMQELELDIFGNYHPHGAYARERQSVGAGRDIFYDAYPVKADKDSHLLGIENITPHLAKNPELEGLTSPNPLSLLKIMPGVVMQFRFRLGDSMLKNGDEEVIIHTDKKLKLFQRFLLDFGIGAKTNVGFGSLEVYETGDTYRYLVQTSEADQRPAQCGTDREQTGRSAGIAPVQRVKRESDIQKGMVLQGKVNGSDSYGNFYITLIPGTRISGKLDGRRLKRQLMLGEIITVRVFDIRDGWNQQHGQPRKKYILDLL